MGRTINFSMLRELRADDDLTDGALNKKIERQFKALRKNHYDYDVYDTGLIYFHDEPVGVFEMFSLTGDAKIIRIIENIYKLVQIRECL